VSGWPSDDAGLLAAVVARYRDSLTGSGEAQRWLARRRIDGAAALDRFEVGFSDRTLGKAMPVKSRWRDDDVRGRLQRLGVLRDSGHEQFRGAVVFPVTDAAGAVVQFYGRTLLDNDRAGTGVHRWLPGTRRGVWNLAGIADGVVVCEGIVDGLSWWCHGFENVTATAGPDGLDDELVGVLRERDVRSVVLSFDNDPAGDSGAREVAVRLAKVGISVSRVLLPVGCDVNDVVVRAKQPADVLGRLLRHAEWILDTPAPRRESSRATAAGPLPSSSPSLAPVEAAAPVEPPAADEVLPLVVDGELRVVFADRRWRVRGLSRVSSFDLLKVNLLVGTGERFHVDSLDLYSARARQVFVVQAAAELGVEEVVVKNDLARVLLVCEAEAERVVKDAQAPKTKPVVVLSEQERSAALGLLSDPRLVDRVVEDFAAVGVVGEATNCLVGYLAAVSRLLDQPLAVIVQSTSAAGKTALMDAVLNFVPAEGRVRFSAMTGQSLFYMGEADLAHKVLAIAEEEGAERASYALKLLQSDGELSIASTGKDAASGRLVTHTYSVKGPSAIVLTTTAIDIDEELLNRCVVLTVDEAREQTRAIHARQRTKQTLAGLVADKRRGEVIGVHQNAQRLLEPVAVVNPFAERLTFADSSTRTRRDHMKYLTLIRAVTLLHQHQRPRKSVMVDGAEVAYVESTIGDIEVANRLAHEVLGQSLDELPPQTRRLLTLVDDYVTRQAATLVVDRELIRFSRRELREVFACGDTQLKVHLARLVDLELVVVHRADHGTGLVYELAWHGQGADGRAFLVGLADPSNLSMNVYNGERSGPRGRRSGSGRPLVGPRSGVTPTTANDASCLVNAHIGDGIEPGLFETLECTAPENPSERVVVVPAGAH
jgi:DNA primase